MFDYWRVFNTEIAQDCSPIERTWWLIASTPNWMIMILHLAYFRQDCADQGDCILTRSRTCHGYIIKCLVISQKCCLTLTTHPMFIKHGPNIDRLVIVCRCCAGGLAEDRVLERSFPHGGPVGHSLPGGLPAMGPLRPLGFFGRWFSAPRQAQSMQNAPLLTLGA